MDNEAFRAYFAAIMPYFRDFKVAINDIIEDEKENKIAIWAKSTAVTDIGPYANEYVLVFHFNEAGDKLERFLEFIDSNQVVGYLTELRKYIAEKEGKK
jgi:ketosteroid isomerase-like protein